MKKAHDTTYQQAEYNLRLNAERARIAAENKQKSEESDTENTNQVNSNSCEVKYKIYRMNDAAAVVTQTARFCGHVDSSNPDRIRLEQYNVYRWLSDVETRIA